MPVEVCTSGGLISASATVYTGVGRLVGLTILTDGSNNVTIVLYDNTAASGTVLEKVVLPAADRTGRITYAIPVKFTVGVYCSLTGTGGACIVHYAPYQG